MVNNTKQQGKRPLADLKRYAHQLQMLATGDGHCTDLPPDMIQDDANVRKQIDLDDGFIESIKRHGILHPIVVTIIKDQLQRPVVHCVAGHRRLLAAKKLGLPLVKCISKTLDSESTLTAAISENLNRTPLHPLDLGESFRTLTERGIAISDLEEMFDRDRKTIARFIKMASWTSRTKQMIRDNPQRFSVRLLLSLASRRLTSPEVERIVEDTAQGGTQAKRSRRPVGEPLRQALEEFFTSRKLSASDRLLIQDALRHLQILLPEKN